MHLLADIGGHMSSRGEESRAKIVAAARQLFYEKGFAQSSMQDLADAAGVLKGNLAYYFTTKEAILDEVVDTQCCNLKALFAGFEQSADTPQASILLFIDMVESSAKQLKEFGCPIGSLNIELGKNGGQYQAYAQTSMKLCLSWLTKCFVATGQKKKAAAASAEHIMCTAQGAAVLAQSLRAPAVVARQCQQLREWLSQQV